MHNGKLEVGDRVRVLFGDDEFYETGKVGYIVSYDSLSSCYDVDFGNDEIWWVPVESLELAL